MDAKTKKRKKGFQEKAYIFGGSKKCKAKCAEVCLSPRKKWGKNGGGSFFGRSFRADALQTARGKSGKQNWLECMMFDPKQKRMPDHY